MDCVRIREELMEGRSTGLTQCLRLAMAALLCTAYSSGTTTAAEGSAAARPTLAVLPFDNDSGAERQQFLAEGMTDSSTRSLSDELARHATALDPKSAEAFVAFGYANLVQKRNA